MRSSEPAGSRAAALTSWSIAALAAVAVAVVRPEIAARYHSLRVNSDVYPLAAPEQMVVASLGYRSALADVIFAHLLVSYGLHFQERRRLEFMGEYLDTINALDPKFRDPYRYADTLLVIAPEPARERDYLKAREVVERGLRNFPYDTELWLTAGQFLVYLGGPHLSDPDLTANWRRDGSKMMARACELASANTSIPYQCIVAANLLESTGEREAAIESLRRLIAVNDDPEIERLALGYLGKRLSERDQERQKRRRAAFRQVWQDDLPFVSRDLLLLMGPHSEVARCAGIEHSAERECVTAFIDWARVVDPVADES